MVKIKVERWRYLEGDKEREARLDMRIAELTKKIKDITFQIVPVMITDDKGNNRWVSAIYTFITYES
jgi:hypothetical protein